MRINRTNSNSDHERIITAYLNGNSPSQISNLMDLKRTTVHQIIKKYQETGQIVAERRAGEKESKLNQEQKNAIKSWIDEDCTLSLRAITEKVFETFQIRICKTKAMKYVKGFHYILKRVNFVPERGNDQSTITQRHAYAQNYINLPASYNEDQIIYIDEVGFNISMRCNYGSSEIGTPATVTVPSIRSKNISICCAMNRNGIVHFS